MSSEILVLLGNIGRSHSLADAIELNCGTWKVKEDKILRSSLVVRAWRAQVLWGRLGLEGILLFVYSNFIL